MPNLDGTGPLGQGPRIGRGMGRGCCRLKCGRGFGLRRFFSFKKDLSVLEEEEKILVGELDAIREEKASLMNKDK